MASPKAQKAIIVLGVAAAIILGVLYARGLLYVHRTLAPPASLKPLALEPSARTAPPVSFTDAAGTSHALRDYRGHYVLLNLWATWCAPCVRELPALARLKAQVPGLTVLAVDVGRDKAPAAAAFLKSHDATGLGTFVDSEIMLVRTFGAYGLPTTALIDPSGKVIARAEGAADWDAPQSIAYFKRLVAGPSLPTAPM